MRALNILVATVLFLTALVLILPFGLKWFIQRYDQEFISREIQLHDVDFNPITGRVVLEDLILLEANAVDTFFQSQSVELDIAWSSLYKKKLWLTEVRLEGLTLNILSGPDRYNFSDLLTAVNNPEDASGDNNHLSWQLDSLRITKSQLQYTDELRNQSIHLDSIRLELDHISDTTTEYPISLAFQLEQGLVDSRIILNTSSAAYQVELSTQSFPLFHLQPYLSDYIHLSRFDARLYAQLQIAGNYNDNNSFRAKGSVDARDLVLEDLQSDSLLSWQSFYLSIDSLDFDQSIFDFSQVRLSRPYVRLALDSAGNNFSKAFLTAKVDSTTTAPDSLMQASRPYQNPFEYLATSLYGLSREYFMNNYLADSIQINEGVLDYYDFTLQEPFRMQLSNISAVATEITAEDQYASFDIRSRVNQSGNLTAKLEISRSGMDNMLFDFKVDNLFLDDLNPYSRYYIAHPFSSGKVIFSSKNSISNYFLDSQNKLFVEKVEVGDKDTVSALYELPMRLAVAILRDLDGNIDLNLPVEGQLDNPKYKLWNTILQILRNLILKAVSAPYRLLAQSVGAKEKDLRIVGFDELQYQLSQEQRRSMSNLAKVLRQKPEFNIRFVSQGDTLQERQQMAILDTWQQWQASLDTVAIDSLSTPDLLNLQDSSFIAFVQAETAKPIRSEAEMALACLEIQGKDSVNLRYQHLWNKRRKSVNQHLLEVEQLDSSRWEFVNKNNTTKDDSLASMPHFTIEYFVTQ